MREVSACRSRVKWSSFIGERAALDIENLSRVSDGVSVKDCVRTSHRRRTQVETHFYTFPRITSVYVRSLVLSMARTALLRVTRVETGHLTGKI